MTARTGLALLLSAAFCTGCAAPTLHYVRVQGPQDAAGISDSYYLQKSVILVARKDTLSKQPDDSYRAVTEIVVASIPKESKAFKVGIQSFKSAWRGGAKVHITKIENTELVKTIGVETSDTPFKISVEGSGGGIVRISGRTAFPTDPAPWCGLGDGDNFVVDPLPAASPTREGGSVPVPAQRACVTIAYGELPPDAVEATAIAWNRDSNLFYYSACREALVTFSRWEGDTSPITRSVRISDPRYVQAVELPYTGNVAVHSQCGVSVNSGQPMTDSTSLGILATSAEQLKAIRDSAR